ncbi:Ceramide-1-phosphate transfer protein [Chionoecetes opilio]|uniref:Ceramide-1-phosphate transfer protein n=1 Tax=Chionoecetes opilio TaxID=41210 RepID=A0A8J4XM54_CHIOP|nr:Ceramide-1-phosphate transfer protein [Chionoecetes opilio]
MINVVKKELAGENRQHYVDVRTMIAYEKKNNLLYRSGGLSGTDALLQLHRALEFVCDFMKELMKDEEEEPALGQVASELYLATVGRFHPSILSRTFSGVLYLLPSRTTIQDRITRENEEAEELMRRVMPEAIWSVTQTYEACQALYRDNDLPFRM